MSSAPKSRQPFTPKPGRNRAAGGPRRDPSGIPTGGQFAATQHPAAGVRLTLVPDLPEPSRDEELDPRLQALLDSVSSDSERFGPTDPCTWGAVVDRIGIGPALQLHGRVDGDIDRAFDEVAADTAGAALSSKLSAERADGTSADSCSWTSITDEAGADRARELWAQTSGDAEAARAALDERKVIAPPADRPWLPGKSGYTSDGQYGTVTGAKFAGYRPAAAIARDIRADLKAAVEHGDLEVPAGTTFSVTTDSYSGGQAINVQIRGLRNDQLFVPHEFHDGEVQHSPMSRDLERAVTAYVEAYNKTTRDPYTDYHSNSFFGAVRFESERGAEYRARDKDRKVLERAVRAAQDAGDRDALRAARAQLAAHQRTPYIAER